MPVLSEIPWIFFSGHLVRRFGLWSIFLFCLAVTVGRLVMYAFLHDTAAIVVAQLLHGVSFGLLHGAAIQFVNRKVPHARLGLGIALYLSLGVGLANFTGSLVGGFLIEWLGFRAMYLIYTVPAVIGIVILLAARRSFDGKAWRAAPSAAGAA